VAATGEDDAASLARCLDFRQRLVPARSTGTRGGAAEDALTNCCGHLLTTLGLATLYPEHTARITAMPAPRIAFTTTNAAQQAQP